MRELSILITADGRQAQAELAKTEQGVQRVSTEAEHMEKTFGATGAGIGKTMAGVAVAIGALNLGQAARKAAEDASKIQDAMETMGIRSAASVQKLIFAATQGGATLQTLTTAVVTMSDKLVEGKIGDVLAGIGLTLADLQKMEPDKAFVTIAEAIRVLPDPLQQTNVALDLFGGRAKTLLPAIRAGFDEVGAGAPLMADSVVAAGDRVGDQIEKTSTQLTNMRASALLPFADFFATYLPQGVQTTIAGLSVFVDSMVPSLETALLGLIAAGGPKAVLSMLSTFFLTTLPAAITGFVSGAGAALLTFFSTTLPAAFTAIITFLGPQGLIALGVIALGLVWYKWGEDIKRIVTGVYTAIADWMGAKLNAIWAGVERKIEEVKSWFAGMYDAVVGHSYVPDMINGIAREFGRLDSAMVSPSRAAANAVKGVFKQLSGEVSGIFGSMLGVLGGMLSGFVGSMVGTLIGKGLDALGGAIGNLFDKTEERGNNTRDAFLGQFGGGGTGEGSGFHNIAALLTQYGAGEGGGSLFSALSGAKTVDEVNAAKKAVEEFLHNAGAPGFHTGGVIPGRGEQMAKVLGGEGVVSHRGMAALEEINRGRGPTLNLRTLEGEVKGLRSDIARQNEVLSFAIRDAILQGL